MLQFDEAQPTAIGHLHLFQCSGGPASMWGDIFIEDVPGLAGGLEAHAIIERPFIPRQVH